MILLLRRYWQLAAIVLLVGVLMLACHQRDNALRAEGAMRVQLAELEAKTHRDSIAGDVAAAIVQRDTIRLVEFQRRVDTLRKTLNLTDTVRTRAFIEAQDTAFKQCRQAVSDLVLSCDAKDTVIRDLRGLLAIRAKAPTSARRAYDLGIGVGYGAVYRDGRLQTGPTVTLGVVWHPF